MVLDILKNKVIARFAFRKMRHTVIPAFEPVSQPNLRRSRIKCGMTFEEYGMTIPFLPSFWGNPSGLNPESLSNQMQRCRTKSDMTERNVGMTAIEQSGRSMIEMLGVLAIIGVLSVGGIAGYSKAMERYRVNETINQISHIVQNTRDLFKNQPNFYGALSFENGSDAYMSNAESMNRMLDSKAKIFPTSIVRNEYKNLFGGDITYYADGRFADDDGKSFILAIHNIPQEACIELATRDWQSGLGLVAMKIQGSGTGYGIQGVYSGNCTTRYKQGNSITCSADMPVSIEYAVISCDN